ncbi:unnamed protein product [Amoebophrya sp. A120]|nr:unnamed protein product [Amoebophrya sp. A120]|eukprot:GSA120T00008671001.1
MKMTRPLLFWTIAIIFAGSDLDFLLLPLSGTTTTSCGGPTWSTSNVEEVDQKLILTSASGGAKSSAPSRRFFTAHAVLVQQQRTTTRKNSEEVRVEQPPGRGTIVLSAENNYSTPPPAPAALRLREQIIPTGVRTSALQKARGGSSLLGSKVDNRAENKVPLLTTRKQVQQLLQGATSPSEPWSIASPLLVGRKSKGRSFLVSGSSRRAGTQKSRSSRNGTKNGTSAGILNGTGTEAGTTDSMTFTSTTSATSEEADLHTTSDLRLIVMILCGFLGVACLATAGFLTVGRQAGGGDDDALDSEEDCDHLPGVVKFTGYEVSENATSDSSTGSTPGKMLLHMQQLPLQAKNGRPDLAHGRNYKGGGNNKWGGKNGTAAPGFTFLNTAASRNKGTVAAAGEREASYTSSTTGAGVSEPARQKYPDEKNISEEAVAVVAGASSSMHFGTSADRDSALYRHSDDLQYPRAGERTTTSRTTAFSTQELQPSFVSGGINIAGAEQEASSRKKSVFGKIAGTAAQQNSLSLGRISMQQFLGEEDLSTTSPPWTGGLPEAVVQQSPSSATSRRHQRASSRGQARRSTSAGGRRTASSRASSRRGTRAVAASQGGEHHNSGVVLPEQDKAQLSPAVRPADTGRGREDRPGGGSDSEGAGEQQTRTDRTDISSGRSQSSSGLRRHGAARSKAMLRKQTKTEKRVSQALRRKQLHGAIGDRDKDHGEYLLSQDQ